MDGIILFIAYKLKINLLNHAPLCVHKIEIIFYGNKRGCLPLSTLQQNNI